MMTTIDDRWGKNQLPICSALHCPCPTNRVMKNQPLAPTTSTGGRQLVLCSYLFESKCSQSIAPWPNTLGMGSRSLSLLYSTEENTCTPTESEFIVFLSLSLSLSLLFSLSLSLSLLSFSLPDQVTMSVTTTDSFPPCDFCQVLTHAHSHMEAYLNLLLFFCPPICACQMSKTDPDSRVFSL